MSNIFPRRVGIHTSFGTHAQFVDSLFRALSQSFMLALGQARLLDPAATDDKMPKLERPISVQFIYSNGQAYYFSAFQVW
jgi:hypothetical protein